jgi:hypothetical protein
VITPGENTTLNRGAREILLRDKEKIEEAQKELERRKAKLKNIRDERRRRAEQAEHEQRAERLERSLSAMNVRQRRSNFHLESAQQTCQTNALR